MKEIILWLRICHLTTKFWCSVWKIRLPREAGGEIKITTIILHRSKSKRIKSRYAAVSYHFSYITLLFCVERFELNRSGYRSAGDFDWSTTTDSGVGGGGSQRKAFSPGHSHTLHPTRQRNGEQHQIGIEENQVPRSLHTKDTGADSKTGAQRGTFSRIPARDKTCSDIRRSTGCKYEGNWASSHWQPASQSFSQPAMQTRPERRQRAEAATESGDRLDFGSRV